MLTADAAAAAAAPSPTPLLPLLAIVEFKWLAAGVGQTVHVERMQRDAEYARLTLERGAASSSSPLRLAAERLRACLPRG
jgi:hypothetical protein